jgi:streptogramin lyase
VSPSNRWIAVVCVYACILSAVFVESARADIAAPGDVFVADYVRGLLRIEPTTNRLTVVDADLRPWRLAIAPDGGLIVLAGGELKRVDLVTGVVTPFASGITGSEGLLIAPDGSAYFIDRESLWKVDPTSGAITVVFSGIDCLVSCPDAEVTGIALTRSGRFFATVTNVFGRAGGVYELDVQAHTGRFVSRRGQLVSPYGLVEAADNTLLVAAREAVFRIDPETGEQSVVSQGGKLSPRMTSLSRTTGRSI